MQSIQRESRDWETPCPKREDKIHCTCWYDGGVRVEPENWKATMLGVVQSFEENIQYGVK